MYKLELAKTEESEKLPTCVGSKKRQRKLKKKSMPVDLVDHNYRKFLNRWEYQTTLPFS